MDLVTLHRKWKQSPSSFLEKEIMAQLDCLIFSVLRSEGYFPVNRPQEEYADLTQDLRLICWKRWITAETDPEGSFLSYLIMSIKGHLKTKVRSLHRAIKRDQALSSYLSSRSGSVDIEESTINSLMLDEFIEQLAPVDQKILRESLEGRTVREISSHLPISKSSVHNHLQEIKERYNERTY